MRALRASEIELRVGRFNETKSGKVIANMLLYKDARVDMALLDEFYPNKWKREHKLVNGNLYCNISIWNDEIKEWITREDVGTESMADKEKGQSSDSFKRAGVNFDIGRELYSKGCKNVAVFLDDSEWYKNNKNKINLSFGVAFYVSHIETLDGQVIELKISDQNNKVRYTYPNKNTITPEKPKQQLKDKVKEPKKMTAEEVKLLLEEVIALTSNKGLTVKAIEADMKEDLNKMSFKTLTTVKARLNTMPDKEV